MFKKRIKNLQESLTKHKLESILVTSPYNIAYLTGIHAFSIEEREARIFLTEQNIYLFTDHRYTEMVKTHAPFVTLIEITHKKPFSKSLNEILIGEKIKQIGFEEENVTYAESIAFKEKIKAKFLPVSDIVEKLREIKDKIEIEKIKKACMLTDRGFDFILPYLKAGITELEIKFILENFIRSKGGALSFESIVAFGKNAAIPHHMSNDQRLNANDIILLDFGAKVQNYCSDMTRTVFLKKPSREFEKMYMATKNAQQIALDYIKSHKKKDFKSDRAAKLANDHLEEKSFPQVPHGLGHGVGLQVHEHPILSPYTKDELKPGIVVTVEPGIYIPNLGGIRIEDTILITTNGVELLTNTTKEMLILP